MNIAWAIKKWTYYKNGEWIIQQDYKNGILWVRYSLIWSVFETKFGLNTLQISDFIDAWVAANTQWHGLTVIGRKEIL